MEARAFALASSLRLVRGVGLVALGATITVAHAREARAQSGPATFVVIGVSDAETGQALQGAQVFFPALGRTSLTDGLGESRTSIPSGTHRIRVRFLGYAAMDTSLSFTGDTSGVVFRLARAATKMDVLEVRTTSPRMKDFEMRRGMGIGRFLTADQLEREGSRPFGIVAMTRFPGLQMVTGADGRPHLSSVRGSCGSETSPSEGILAGARTGASGGRSAANAGGASGGSTGSASGTGGGTGSGTSGPTASSRTLLGSCTPGRQCYVVTFLDGIQLDSSDFDLVTTWDVGGVEYYSGNNVPSRYRVSGAACGVMLVWSK
ncbi:MAG TPA: carboxypeptidase-like regulatory domain-containing protein [Gemmatimonadaceae bacterium]|nr:carboxypeptidase-like regulatory domain-containing protein [Gemmatimonadaceae bacterium]